MGYYDSFDNQQMDTGKSSQFNAGLLQMKRLHETQDLLNRANLNPLALNEEVGVYNFEILFSSVNSLLNEASPKLGKVEREDAEFMRDAIKNFMLKKPVFEVKKNIKVGSNGMVNKFNETNWRTLQRWLTKYETLVRDLLDKHSMNSPDKEDDEGL